MRSNTLTARLTALPGNVRGVLWGIGAALFFSVMLTLIKLLGEKYSVPQILLVRQIVMLVTVLPVIIRTWPQSVLTQRIGLHFLRVIFATIAMFSSFAAVIHLPLADATAIGFSRSFFVTIFAIIILHEVVGGRRWLATLAGFVGVIIMINPTGGGLNVYALLAVTGAAAAAMVSVFLRIMSRTDKPETILTYQAVLVGLIVLPLAVMLWQPMGLIDWILGIGVGVAAACGQMCNIRSFRAGEASVVAPLDYTKLIWTTILGFVFFAAFPQINTLIGAAIIVGASLYTLLREMNAKKASTKPLRAPSRPGDGAHTEGQSPPPAASRRPITPDDLPPGYR